MIFSYLMGVNGVFTLVFLASAAIFLFTKPDAFLSSLLSGGEKAAALSLTLLSVYCVWLAFFRVAEECGADKKLSRLLTPLSGRLFRTKDENALSLAATNLSANLLGLPGAPTPPGIRATEAFCKQGNHFAADLLFVLNATGLQILPVTVIALRQSFGSSSPSDVVLPTLLSTLLCTLLGVAALSLLERLKGKRRRK